MVAKLRKSLMCDWGMVKSRVGTSETLATNQDCNRNSRQAKGLLGRRTNVSSIIAEKPPIAWTGFNAALVDTITYLL